MSEVRNQDEQEKASQRSTLRELTAEDVIYKLANSPGYLPEGVEPESIVGESPEASTILSRFVKQFS